MSEEVVKSRKSINRLTHSNLVKLIIYLSKHSGKFDGGLSRDIAELAGESLGFKVTDYNIRGVADEVELKLADAPKVKVYTSGDEIDSLRENFRFVVEKITKDIQQLCDELTHFKVLGELLEDRIKVLEKN